MKFGPRNLVTKVDQSSANEYWKLFTEFNLMTIKQAIVVRFPKIIEKVVN
jgi:hypothetical protein